MVISSTDDFASTVSLLNDRALAATVESYLGPLATVGL